MIIVRDVFGGISINPVHLYVDGNEITAGFRDYNARISEFFECKGKTSEALDWIFEQNTWKGTECKKVIELMTRGLSGAEAYYMGNIIKYLYRYPKKGTLETDLAKAAQYMEFLKEHFAKKEESGHAE